MRNRNKTASPWDDPAYVTGTDKLTENLAAPVVRRSAAARRAQRRWLKAVVFVLAPVGFLVLVADLAGHIQPDHAGSSTDPVQANTAPGKAAASAEVATWLAGKPTPLPGGKVLSWDGYTLAPQAPAVDGVHPDRVEVDFFTLIATGGDGSSVFFKTSVESRVQPSGVVAVSSTPTLIPLLPAQTSGSSANTWPGWSSVTASDSVTQAVQAWAAAFTSGDSGALRLAVGDKNSSHAYVGLNGAAVTKTQVVTSAAKTSTGSNTAAPSTIIARVTINITWPGQNGTTGSAPAQVMYDLLVVNADTGSPQVVAWGGAGSGPSLTAYQNAVPQAVLGNTQSGGPAGITSTTTPTPAP